ncbi:type IV pilin protein [Acinetobacter sp. Marseille-Q1623]|uniref:type IV pilin protein n=1 Tax=Acinetobacter sp. Marseille-Q1623 TaxID=2697501 RepID=UPI00157AE7DC|nr:type IV pilin protein [Acinetobacter sp. Marseille-Q1623]
MKNDSVGKTSQTRFNQGFTLIELMVVVVIIAILAAIAIPSYQHFVRRANVAQAQQEMQKIAEQLERYKARNFSFKGFNANYLYPSNSVFDVSSQTLNLNSKYTITLVDSMTGNPLLTDSSSSGQGWSIKAISQDPANYSLLLTSAGVHCKNITQENMDYDSCGDAGFEEW